LAAGADGVHIEVHDHPEQAFSDGPQALSPQEFAATFAKLEELARVFNATF
jgi:3-deoxy-7-phosphoheptulonate synthase